VTTRVWQAVNRSCGATGRQVFDVNRGRGNRSQRSGACRRSWGAVPRRHACQLRAGVVRAELALASVSAQELSHALDRHPAVRRSGRTFLAEWLGTRERRELNDLSDVKTSNFDNSRSCRPLFRVGNVRHGRVGTNIHRDRNRVRAAWVLWAWIPCSSLTGPYSPWSQSARKSLHIEYLEPASKV